MKRNFLFITLFFIFALVLCSTILAGSCKEKKDKKLVKLIKKMVKEEKSKRFEKKLIKALALSDSEGIKPQWIDVLKKINKACMKFGKYTTIPQNLDLSPIKKLFEEQKKITGFDVDKFVGNVIKNYVWKYFLGF